MFSRRVMVVMGLMLAVGIGVCGCRRIKKPKVTSVDGKIKIDGASSPVVFARSGRYWGAAWFVDNESQGRVHINLRCREAVYFLVFDDALKLAVDAPIRVLRRKCVPGRRINLVATPNGFAISPSGVGARFELSSKRFIKGSAFPKQTRLRRPAGKLRAPSECAAARVKREADQPLDGGAWIRVWVESCPSGKPGRASSKAVRYLFTPDGHRVTKVSTLLPLKSKSSDRIKIKFVRIGKTVSVFVRIDNKIYRQQFQSNGNRRGQMQLIVQEKASEAIVVDEAHKDATTDIFNFNVGVRDGHCVVLFTRGNSTMKVYSCKTGKKRFIGYGVALSMFCAGKRCLVGQSGMTLQYLSNLRATR